MMTSAQPEEMNAAAHAHQAVTLWHMKRHQQAANQYLEAIARDPRWRDDLLDACEEHGWALTMLKTLNEIRQYLYAHSMDSTKYPRITSHPGRLDGAPTIRGMRLAVETIARMAVSGATEAEIIDRYPEAEPADIDEAVRFAAENPLLINAQV
jgi:uncharacterized protein (DUF433 family)